ncbi:MAG: hypothetical protein RBU37_17950, partial [Myxococcota bacterium]|nr:hypothetical protein [Myxococcota bacterium]
SAYASLVAFVGGWVDDTDTGPVASQLVLFHRIEQVFSVVELGSASQSGFGHRLSLSSDGRFIALELDGVVVYDRVTQTMIPVSVDWEGNLRHATAPSISGDRRFVAFASPVPLLFEQTAGSVQVYVRDLLANKTQLLSRSEDGAIGDGDSGGGRSEGSPRISRDGCFVTFSSRASNLVPYDLNQQDDIFRVPIAL